MPLAIDLTGRRAIITGASSGIGLGVAGALAAAGCDVAGCGLDPAESPGAGAFQAAVAAAGRHGHYRAADLVDPAQARGFVAWAAEALGGVDLVISNAGANIFGGVAATTDEAWERNAQLNLAHHWRVAQAAKPHLDRAARPVVLVMASNHAFTTLPGCFPYNVAKAGLTALVRAIAIEWGPHVRAVGVAPGFIDTPMNDVWFGAAPDPAARRAEVERLHPVGRIGTPEEVGALCAFLCSPLAGFISGTTILVDGGRSAVMQDGLST